MGAGLKHWIAGAAGVAMAAAVNVTTGMFTQHWAARWVAATIALVVVGGGLEVVLLRASARSPARQRVNRTKVGGGVRQRLAGSGEQSVTGSEIAHDLDQLQGTGGDAA